MKKIYSAPQLTTVVVNVKNCILAGSPGLKDEGYNSASECLSRDFDAWDDED